MIRYALPNWENHFIGSGKQSTIRTHAIKDGKHLAVTGSRFKPDRVGWVWKKGELKKQVWELTPFDAVRDGFRGKNPKQVLAALLLELGKRNPDLNADSEVFINFTPRVVPFEERMCRECGCTQQESCEPPCYWVEDDLCSGCA